MKQLIAIAALLAAFAIAAWFVRSEQKLHEYLSRRVRTSPIEVTGIACIQIGRRFVA